MQKFVPVMAIAALLVSAIAALAGENKATTLSCLQVPELCKCTFLDCVWSTVRVQPIRGNRLLYGATWGTSYPVDTWSCQDLSYEGCMAANCKGCD